MASRTGRTQVFHSTAVQVEAGRNVLVTVAGKMGTFAERTPSVHKGQRRRSGFKCAQNDPRLINREVVLFPHRTYPIRILMLLGSDEARTEPRRGRYLPTNRRKGAFVVSIINPAPDRNRKT